MGDSGGIKIKLCGLRTPEDIAAVNEAKPDFGGFIVEYPKSFRSISRDTLRLLTARLRPEILPVGVFVNMPVNVVADLLEEGTIRAAQLHGQEDEHYIRELRSLTDKPLIKAFSIKTREDILRALESTADYILLDHGRGGTGKAFDWDLVPDIPRPFFLAGGLGPENLREAVSRLHPWAVDLSSSLETDKKKDPEKIRKFMEVLREIPG